LGIGRVLKVHNKDDFSAKAPNAQCLHQRYFLVGRIQAQKTDSLLGALVHGREDIQPCDLSKLLAQLLQRGLQRGNVWTLLEIIKCIHDTFTLMFVNFAPQWPNRILQFTEFCGLSLPQVVTVAYIRKEA
jgi:hypothetical protein